MFHGTHNLLRPLVLSLFILWSTQGCGEAPPDAALPASYIRVHIDKSEPKRLLDYYFGGYVTPAPRDPFEAGILIDTSGYLYVNIDSLAAHYPSAPAELADGDGNNRIDWEELEAFIDASYYKARRLPLTLDTLFQEVEFEQEGGDWIQVQVDGVMTIARRRLAIRESAVRTALENYWENGERLIYPEGTIIIGEHFIEERRAETSVMRKRQDGFWDFAVYNGADSLARTTVTPPRELKSPVQCVGCHFGSKLFEPEKSFPVKAAPGPHGPRQIYVDDLERDADVVKYFDEHRRRSDTVLGLYSTLFIAKLKQQRRSGTLEERDAALLDELGL